MKVALDENCKTEYENLKFRRTETRYLTFRIEKETIVTSESNVGHWKDGCQDIELAGYARRTSWERV